MVTLIIGLQCLGHAMTVSSPGWKWVILVGSPNGKFLTYLFCHVSQWWEGTIFCILQNCLSLYEATMSSNSIIVQNNVPKLLKIVSIYIFCAKYVIDLVVFFPLGEKFRKMILKQFSTFRQTEQNGIALYKIPFLVPHILVFFGTEISALSRISVREMKMRLQKLETRWEAFELARSRIGNLDSLCRTLETTRPEWPELVTREFKRNSTLFLILSDADPAKNKYTQPNPAIWFPLANDQAIFFADLEYSIVVHFCAQLYNIAHRIIGAFPCFPSYNGCNRSSRLSKMWASRLRF